MNILNYTEFRRHLAKSLDQVNDDRETLIVSRSKGKTVVLMDLSEYNSIMETFYLMKSESNRRRLQQAIDDVSNGLYEIHSLS